VKRPEGKILKMVPCPRPPASVVPKKLRNRRLVPDVDTGRESSIDENAIQHLPPRCIQGGYVAVRSDRHLNGLAVRVVERRTPNRWRG